jgi:Ca2+-transporting ATPase
VNGRANAPRLEGATRSRIDWYAITIDETLARTNTNIQEGLTSEVARERLTEFGPNELTSHKGASAWKLLLSQFQNVLMIILLSATTASFFLGHAVESMAIGVIVLFSVVLGFIQEYRAERAIESLRRMAAPNASVLRDGRVTAVPARELVPGDVVQLKAGNKVPADARIVETINLRVDEAILTGESVPVDKTTAPIEGASIALGDQTNSLFLGTTVTYGRGQAVVVATGDQTELGQIAGSLRQVKAVNTPLQENLDRVGKILAIVGLFIIVIIVALGLANQQSELTGDKLVDLFIFGIALAIAVVPEALPAAVTVSLAVGVQRMIKRHVLVRRLPVVETLGTTSQICSDKTGTLTKDEMTARRLFVDNELWGITGSGYNARGCFISPSGEETSLPPAHLIELLEAGALCTDAFFDRDDEEHWKLYGDPTEAAIVVAACKAGIDPKDLQRRSPRIGETPFNSESKRMTVVCQRPEGAVAITKGAPEVIVELCEEYLTKNGHVPFGVREREAALDAARQMACEALRVLAIARGPMMTDHQSRPTFLGLLGMLDPPRPEAKVSIATCRSAGIGVVMVTGDHPLTARAIAEEIGILKGGRVVTGAELEAMSEEDLRRDIASIDVYARVNPAHKLRVVEAFQSQGLIVAVTGDGANDAPALRKANIGIAMGRTGTDVAKEAADMMLIDDNFSSIVAAIEEGRGIFSNIKKYLMYLLSSNIGEIGLMTTATILGYPLPLSATQLLYVNLATDGLPAIALAVDPIDDEIMHRPPRRADQGVFTRPVIVLMLVGGLWSTVANLGLFAWARQSGRSDLEAMTMTFACLVFIEFLKAYCFRSERASTFQRPFANGWLNLAIGWEMFLLLVVIYLPVLHEPMNTFSLTLRDWSIIATVAATIIPVLEITKAFIRRIWTIPSD